MTGEKLFEIALDLLNLRKTTGELPENCNDMRTRATNIINICLAECAPLNNLLQNRTDNAFLDITGLSETIPCDELLAVSVLPFGVAAYLCGDEDPVLSRLMENRYRTAYRNIQRASKAKIRPVTEVY
ncbi:MAG: hypothetical protein E7674_00510 [Ruminococcaceae bacterium]|nr:hypothetical protein [Oscillospiraceae bacterium]